jgi:hypothetical protein
MDGMAWDAWKWLSQLGRSELKVKGERFLD